jgi:transposase
MLSGMRDMSVTEQRYRAVLDLISEGRTVMDVAGQWGVNRRTVHRWLARYEAQGLEGLPDRSHRPEQCPHKMSAEVEVLVLELRRTHPYWGARRLVVELGRKGASPAPSQRHDIEKADPPFSPGDSNDYFWVVAASGNLGVGPSHGCCGVGSPPYDPKKGWSMAIIPGHSWSSASKHL